MATSVLVIQGAGRGAHDADRAIADELQLALGGDFRVSFPHLPGEADPEPDAWRQAITQLAQDRKADVIVAHSVGAALVADMLAEGAALPGARAAALLAPPYVGSGGWDFGGYHFDAHRAHPPTLQLALSFYFGASDRTVPLDHAVLFKKVFPHASFTRLAGCDHQFAGHLPAVARGIRDRAC